MHNFKELKVWQDSMILAKQVLTVTQPFPIEERFGMTAQMRKCSVSIPSNIAEGAGRSSNKDFCRFLDIAIGSAYELETQILLSLDFGYLSVKHFDELISKTTTIQKMLNSLRNKLGGQE